METTQTGFPKLENRFWRDRCHFTAEGFKKWALSKRERPTRNPNIVNRNQWWPLGWERPRIRIVAKRAARKSRTQQQANLHCSTSLRKGIEWFFVDAARRNVNDIVEGDWWLRRFCSLQKNTSMGVEGYATRMDATTSSEQLLHTLYRSVGLLVHPRRLHHRRVKFWRKDVRTNELGQSVSVPIGMGKAPHSCLHRRKRWHRIFAGQNTISHEKSLQCRSTFEACQQQCPHLIGRPKENYRYKKTQQAEWLWKGSVVSKGRWHLKSWWLCRLVAIAAKEYIRKCMTQRAKSTATTSKSELSGTHVATATATSRSWWLEVQGRVDPKETVMQTNHTNWCCHCISKKDDRLLH